MVCHVISSLICQLLFGPYHTLTSAPTQIAVIWQRSRVMDHAVDDFHFAVTTFLILESASTMNGPEQVVQISLPSRTFYSGVPVEGLDKTLTCSARPSTPAPPNAVAGATTASTLSAHNAAEAFGCFRLVIRVGALCVRCTCHEVTTQKHGEYAESQEQSMYGVARKPRYH